MSGAPRDWLADAKGTARRLAAEFEITGDAELYGEICGHCDQRWSLPADRASCPHKPICEDCWPNGCEDCAWQLHEDMAHREKATNRILSATLELRTGADDLSETDLLSLDWRTRKDVLRHIDLTFEALRRVRDVLRSVEKRADGRDY